MARKGTVTVENVDNTWSVYEWSPSFDWAEVRKECATADEANAFAIAYAEERGLNLEVWK